VVGEHFPGGEGTHVDHHVRVRRQVLVQNTPFPELDAVGQVVGRPKGEVVQGDDVVVSTECVRDVRSDEPGAARHEHALAFHGRLYRGGGVMRTGLSAARRTI